MLLLNQYLFGGIVASILGLLLLSQLSRGKRKKKDEEEKEIGAVCEMKQSRHGECGSGDGPYVVVVGAGVAGSALAYTLGKDGRRVRVIERDLTEPDRIVGELLQPGGYLKLIELGLEDCVDKIDAQRVLGYALFKDGKDTKLSYPLENYNSDVAGRSFHNGRFIQRMREKAASLPNVQLEQGTVTSLIKENGTVKGLTYKSKSGEELRAYAPLTIVCDGCFSNLRRVLCSPKVDVPSCFVGLVLDNCQLPYPNHGHVVLGQQFPDVKALLKAIKEAAIARHFEPKIEKSDLIRYFAKCAKEGCPWRIRAVKLPNAPTFTIRAIGGTHTCGKNAQLGHHQASVDWTVNLIEERLRDNVNYKPKDMLQDIQKQYGITIPYKQAWRAKERGLAAIYGSSEEGYCLLPAYCEQIKQSNPRKHCSVIYYWVRP